jgi:hypothetical protein
MRNQIRRWFGVGAPRVAIRAHIPWPLRALALVVLGGIGVAFAWWIYDAGRKFAATVGVAPSTEVRRLEVDEHRLQKENEQLAARAGAAESQLQMERAARDELARQVKALAEENSVLKEDLAFFHNLVPKSAKEGGPQVYRFKVERDTLPGEYRYALLLVQTGQRAKEFQGSLQLVVNLNHNGARKVITLPEDQGRFPRGQPVSFKYYQRVDGRFRVAPDILVEGVQARVYANGASEAAATQTAKVSRTEGS